MMMNLIISSKSAHFLQQLEHFGIVQRGHFEYKGKAEDGSRLHGDYYINYRMLTTNQELALSSYYEEAIQEWFPGNKNLIIVGVAMASLILPKVIQIKLFPKTGIEYAYTEKRDGVLGIFGEQVLKCKGKHLLFIEDVCNNGTSSKELMAQIEKQKNELQITGFSILYGVHRGHTYFEEPQGAFYAMAHLKALSYHPSQCPVCKERKIPLKEYKK